MGKHSLRKLDTLCTGAETFRVYFQFFALFLLLIQVGLYPSVVSAAEPVWEAISTAQVSVQTANPVRNRRSTDATVNITLTNVSGKEITGPLRLVIGGLSPANKVSIGNAGGVTVAGEPYFDLTSYVGANFAPGDKGLINVIVRGGGPNIFTFAPRVEQQISQSQAAVNILEPANFSFFNIGTVTVTGTVTADATGVTVNGIPANLSDQNWSASIPLQEGNNTLTAVATKTGGAVDTASIQVTLDTTPPRVTVDAPADGFKTTEDKITVTGIVNDIVVGTVNSGQAQVTVNGLTAQVANRTYIAADIPLQTGPNTIQVIGRDQVGNSATTTITVTREAVTAPFIKQVSGNGQSGQAGAALAQPLVVQLLDGQTPVPNVPVIFKITENDGYLTITNDKKLQLIAANTNAEGKAGATLTLGNRAGAGNNIVEAYATGYQGTALFTASGTPTAVANINVDAGTNQFGAVNNALSLPFVAVVTDAGHNRLGGVPVTFTVTQGGGNINGKSGFETTSDSDGRVQALLTLGPGAGQDNNVVEANFSGNTGFAAAFSASGKVPGDPNKTSISGVVLDNSNNPIPNATMRVFKPFQGTSNNQHVQVGDPVLTDDKGAFKILPAPVGIFKLMADGTTATLAGKQFPTLEYDLLTVAGQDNTVGMPIYLPALDPDAKVCVTATTGGVLKMASSPGFSLNIAPGSATFPGGSKTGCVSVTPVNPDKVPMVPGFGQQPRYVVTIQPVGTTFNPPAAMTIPNMDGLAPNAKTEMYSYDHDLAAFVAIGSGSVSADGSVIASDPGIGVMKAGWHCGGNPNSTGSAGTCPECQKCRGSNCVSDDTKKDQTCDDKDKCTAKDKCADGSCEGEPITVQINPSFATICVGRAKGFGAETIPLERPVNWSSSGGASVDSSGVVTAITVGMATVTATDADCDKAKDSKSVNVMNKESSADGLGQTLTCLNPSVSLACLKADTLQNEIDPPKDQGVPTWISTNFTSITTPGDCRKYREGSEMDAATHAYLACRLYRAVGETNAKKILDSHEFEHPEDECISHEQDFNNNEIGRHLAAQAKQDSDCSQLTFAELNAGRLQVNSPYSSGICTWTGKKP